MNRLTPQRRKCLEYLVARGCVPPRHEIARHMGWTWSSSASDVLNWLRYRGYLRRSGHAEWEITDAGRKAVEQKDDAA